ncbi:A-kinase anchor protein 6-like, partial [Diretmus argenteus]
MAVRGGGATSPDIPPLDVCEDISDHVEQIHALLETEFSLKLLSYSVNIIVDIRTVQLLWHQLRVSVLVLKERLLQGLQDSNGNYTRQTDILQAFTQDQHQTRLDALTEVDDCGQLTIRCSQDYFSLDCGITAFELSDYSPGDEPEARGTDLGDEGRELDQGPGHNPEPEENRGTPAGSCSYPELQRDIPEPVQSVDLPTAEASEQEPGDNSATPGDSLHHARSLSTVPTMQGGGYNHSEGSLAKRPLQGGSLSSDVSPTQPSLPKRAALFSEGGTGEEEGGRLGKACLAQLQFQAELSRSTPSLLDPPDRSKFWLELDSVYPENVSQSYESLQVMNGRNLQRNLGSSREGGAPEGWSSSGPRQTAGAPPPLRDPASQTNTPKQMEKRRDETRAHSEGDSDSSLPSPMREQLLSSDQEASGEESDPQPPPGKPAVWIIKRQGQKGARVSAQSSPDRQHWYGSEEFLALPAQLRKTEMLAMKLESLAQAVPLRPSDSTHDALQDVDDWELTELNPDWDLGESGENINNIGESGGDIPSPPPHLLSYRRSHSLVGRFSPTSSSDIAPSLNESIESGPLSDLQSEDEEGRRSGGLQRTAPPVDTRGGASLVQQLLEDIQQQDQDPDIWKKIE